MEQDVTLVHTIQVVVEEQEKLVDKHTHQQLVHLEDLVVEEYLFQVLSIHLLD